MFSPQSTVLLRNLPSSPASESWLRFCLGGRRGDKHVKQIAPNRFTKELALFTTWRNLGAFSRNNGGCIGNREEVHGSNEDKVYRLASFQE